MLDRSILEALRDAVNAGNADQLSGLITETNQLQTYECDGLTNFRTTPDAVLLPRNTEQVQAIVRICARHRIPFVARGSGTGLSGGALPAKGGIVISFARMNRILEIDIPNQRVVVEPGVINAHVTEAVAAHGYFYAPDPSSQSVCSIGGNVAENAGGAHCLKYGFTTTHVLGMDVVLPSGELVRFGSAAPDAPGYDLTGVFVGSEGTLGVATKIILRIVKRPETVQVLLAAFDSIHAAAQTVSDIIAAGMLPAALEMMDRLAAMASEAAVHPNYPVCEALLLVELDGPEAEVAAQMVEAIGLCRKNGAWEVRVAQTADERGLIWKGRKAAFAAVGRISPNYIVQDGVIPRTALPRVLEEQAAAMARRMIELFEQASVETIVINAAGCGSTMKQYGHLLRDDPQWAERARSFSAKCRDITEVLCELGPVAPRNPLPLRIAYHDACHLRHAQGIHRQPRQLLNGIPGLEIAEIAEPALCCGSAGVYNLLQPEPAQQLADRKVSHLLSTQAKVVVSANPGCLLQLKNGLRRRGHEDISAFHMIELLDASIRGMAPEELLRHN